MEENYPGKQWSCLFALAEGWKGRVEPQGDVEGSVRYFDEALAADPALRPYLWQRGLSLYYLGSPENPDLWQEGAAQFRDDVAVNPSDTEESIWAFMCEARLFGPVKARSQMLEVRRVELDATNALRARKGHCPGCSIVHQTFGDVN